MTLSIPTNLSAYGHLIVALKLAQELQQQLDILNAQLLISPSYCHDFDTLVDVLAATRLREAARLAKEIA